MNQLSQTVALARERKGVRGRTPLAPYTYFFGAEVLLVLESRSLPGL